MYDTSSCHHNFCSLAQNKNQSITITSTMHSSLLLILFSPLALAFAPNKTAYQKTSTALDAVSRRDALASGVSTLLGVAAVTSLPKQSSAFSQQLEYYQVESSQMRTDGKYDLNSAAVVSQYFFFHEFHQ